MMKKLFTLFSLLPLMISVQAQQIPNGGFEQWTSPDHPDFWSTNAMALPFPGLEAFAVKDTIEYREGRASLRLTTDTFTYLQTQYTFASQAGLGSDTFIGGRIYFSGVPFHQRINTLRLRYKYTPARPAIDSGLMQLDLISGGTSIMRRGLGWHIGSTHGNWDSAFFVLDSTKYSSTATPDTLKLVFYSSITGGGTDPAALGCTLWLDDIQVTTPTTSIASIGRLIKGVNIYPNPATDLINLNIGQSELGSEIRIIDIDGRELFKEMADKENISIDARSWAAGVYSIYVRSTDRITTYQGKVSVNH